MKKMRFLSFILSLCLILSVFTVTIPAENIETEVLRGDANSDGAVNLKDLILLRRYFAYFDYSSGVSLVEISKSADMNGDGNIGLQDIGLLRKYLVDRDTENGDNEVFDLVDFTVSVPSDREPVILQITDTQIIDSTGTGKWSFWAADKMGVECFDYITEIVEQNKPDLILLTGDMVYGEYDKNGTSFMALIELMESFNIPWAPIFGNHEAESAMGIDWQCAQLEAAENCLFMQRELTGNGNYTVGIKQGGELTRVFFMVDSNGCNNPSEESLKNTHLKNRSGFGADQIEWYTSLINNIKSLSPATKFSFAFHTQLKVFLDSFNTYTESDTGTAFIDRIDDKNNSDFGYIGDERNVGFDSDYTIWNGLKALGVDSIFVGHMHSQSASIVYEGIRLQFGMKSSTYDRINYVNSDGTIEAGYRLSGKTPWVGGTVMKLSPDGDISDAYIYYCQNAGGSIDWDSLE